MLSPSDSDNRVLNSRPPKPAPNTTIRDFMNIPQLALVSFKTVLLLGFRQAGAVAEGL